MSFFFKVAATSPDNFLALPALVWVPPISCGAEFTVHQVGG